MFQGTSSLHLDAKGRVTVPSRHRDVLLAQCEGRLTLTRHPDGCLLLFPRGTWEIKREEIRAFPIAARDWQRIFLGSAEDVDMDASGRILISPELRQASRIERQLVFMGMGAHFELWDPPSLHAREQQAIDAGMPDALSHFTL
jgi:MraZ protein